ncbi:MAG: hypothetical protein P8N29_10520 [Saprospiraceae bacterium]|nr:hypothetical protein [Saprospiraceae bacterium]
MDHSMDPDMEIDSMENQPIAYIEEIGRFPSVINECSGMININNRIISMNDGSTHTLLQEINPNTAELITTINVAKTSNIDWEALQYNNENIYIADTGNNEGDRENLSLYTIPYQAGTEIVCIDTINFIWPDQTEFMSSNSHPYDCESMLVEGNVATFFSKNRSDLKTNVYRLDLTTEVVTKGESISIGGLATDAVIDPSGNVILLSYLTFNGNTFANKINILSIVDGVYVLKESIPISETTQIEAIVHLEDHKYLLGAESESSEGGYLYSLDLAEFYE